MRYVPDAVKSKVKSWPVGLGYVEGRRGARGGVVPRDGEGDAVLGCGGGVGVGGL